MNRDQAFFLVDEFSSLAIMASLQRSKTYAVSVTESDKRHFKISLRYALATKGSQYMKPIAESDHIQNIVTLADELSFRHGEILYQGRFRIGSSQKALNLYLKYLWCIGQIPTPPHCPFDNIIISDIPGVKDVQWTSLDDIAVYQDIVRSAQNEAGDIPLAVWELRKYNRSRRYTLGS